MEDSINLMRLAQGFQALAIPDIGLDQREIGLPHHRPHVGALDVRIIELIEIVQAQDPFLAGNQRLDDMRADKSGAAGH
jgi:hypothetical protein